MADENDRKTIANVQTAYDLGYRNPGASPTRWKWAHLVYVNAFASGQSDAQNEAPRNPSYSDGDYNPKTFERIAPAPLTITIEGPSAEGLHLHADGDTVSLRDHDRPVLVMPRDVWAALIAEAVSEGVLPGAAAGVIAELQARMRSIGGAERGTLAGERWHALGKAVDLLRAAEPIVETKAPAEVATTGCNGCPFVSLRTGDRAWWACAYPGGAPDALTSEAVGVSWESRGPAPSACPLRSGPVTVRLAT